MPAERISATYLIETPLEVNRAAAVLAGEQSSGTFVEVPGETDEIRRRFGARVEKISELAGACSPSLPVKRPREDVSGQFRRAEIVVSWPI
jgi:ribulose-bisphosphate carboxylase large chain